jgi:hypothetical protein
LAPYCPISSRRPGTRRQEPLAGIRPGEIRRGIRLCHNAPQRRNSLVIQLHGALCLLALALCRYRRRMKPLSLFSQSRGIRHRQPPAPATFRDAFQCPLTLPETETGIRVAVAHLLR